MSATLVLGLVGESRQLSASAVPSEAPALSQITTDVLRALELNRAATSRAEWTQSGFTPEEIFASTEALGDARAWQDLCSSLEALGGEGLALFEEAIERYSRSTGLACGATLQAKLQRYWREAHDRFAADFGESDGAAARDPGSRELTLAFTRGPHPSRTPRILHALSERGIRAQFFAQGSRVRANPHLSKDIADAGHVLGSEGWNGSDLSRLTSTEAEREIVAAQRSVEAASGATARLFRFPHGETEDHLRDFVRSQGLTEIGAGIESPAWKLRNAGALYRTTLTALEEAQGGILVLDESSEATAILLPRLLDELTARGYAFVSLDN
ncbi:MAG: polysaccharide deacetylase family protein [Oligoflexia bacterium]|nr:polysaccharide deacetylase family protein [Oligoflexia bacterium]